MRYTRKLEDIRCGNYLFTVTYYNEVFISFCLNQFVSPNHREKEILFFYPMTHTLMNKTQCRNRQDMKIE